MQQGVCACQAGGPSSLRPQVAHGNVDTWRGLAFLLFSKVHPNTDVGSDVEYFRSSST